jgi:hypothetical protein
VGMDSDPKKTPCALSPGWVFCPCCGGHALREGAIVVIDDERGQVEAWGWEPCAACDGEGEVTPALLAALLAASDPTHGAYPDPLTDLGDDVLCPF